MELMPQCIASLASTVIDFCTIHSCFYYCMCAYISFIYVYFYDDVSGLSTLSSIKLID